MKDSKTLLKQLTERYKKHQVSVLVGAGFSRNAYEKFPMWWGLMYDLMIEMYGSKIKEDYATYCHTQRPFQKMTYQLFEEKELERIASEKSYLKIVSDYIRYKGNRESMDVYIEKRIPYLTCDKGKYQLNIDPTYSFDSNNLDVHASLLSCNWLDVYTTNYDNLLEQAAADRNLLYKKVSVDYDLGNHNMARTIVKLHGDLVNDSLTDSFEFDNDNSLRYIIAQEDYDTYPEKHQVFTQLMRIAMLKGAFLLVGFSGTDPNFLAWLNWMKDVLDKDPESNKGKEKIYLVLVKKEPLSLEQDLYFKNHRIGVIYLDDPDLVAEIQGQRPNGKPVPMTIVNTTKERFKLLFKYLRNVELEDAATSDKRNTLWGEIDSKITSKKNLDEVCAKLNALPNHFRINQQIPWQDHVLDDLDRLDHSWSDQEILIANEAMKDTGILSTLIFSEQHKSDAQKAEVWSYLSNRLSVLQNNYHPIEKTESDESAYLNLLHYAFNLEFEKFKGLLDSWKPNGRYVQCWASFTSLTSKEKSVNKLDEYIATESNIQEKYLASMLRNSIDFQVPPVYTYYEYSNVTGFFEVYKPLLLQLKTTDKKIKPHGWVGKEFNFGGEVGKCRASINILNLLIETGFLPSYFFVSVVGCKDWYSVFKYVYEMFPYPCLFYSLLYGDESVVKRIGQDYAYSDNLIKDLPHLLKNVMNCVKNDTYLGNWQSYWQIMAEMAVAVNPDQWIDVFIEIMKVRFLPNLLNFTYSTAPHECVNKMLKYLSLSEHKDITLNTLLDFAEQHPIEVGHLMSSLKIDQEINKEILDKIRSIVQILPASKSHYIVVSLYENESAKKTLIPIVAEKILKEELPLTNFDRLNYIHVISYLTNSKPDVIAKVKDLILGMNIWDCGVDSASNCHNPMYFDLSHISKDIVWSRDELKTIAENMQINLNLLGQMKDFDNFFCDDYIRLLSAMVNFIDNRVKDEDKDLFSQIQNIANGLISQMTLGFDYFQAMSSDDHVMITSNGHKLIARIVKEGIKTYEPEIAMCISRAMFPGQTCLVFILSMISYLAEKYSEEMCCGQNGNMVKSLLKLYSEKDLIEYDIQLPYVYLHLKKIAAAVAHYDADSSVVKYWKEDPKVNRFNV